MQPVERVALDDGRVAGVGQARAVAAAEPEHLGRHPVGPQDPVVGDRLVEREERVDGALDEERRNGDLVDEVARAAGAEPGQVVGREPAARDAGRERRVDVRVKAPAGLPGRVEDARPARLDGRVLVEARLERVPRDVGHDRVEALVERRGHELDAAAVGGAGHAHARIAGLVELGLGLGGHEVDELLHVAALGVRAVDGGRAARGAEAARIPGQDVVAGGPQRPDADGARPGVGGAVLVGGAPGAPARAEEHGGRLLPRRQIGRREEREHDGRAVERRHRGVASERTRRPKREHRGERRAERDEMSSPASKHASANTPGSGVLYAIVHRTKPPQAGCRTNNRSSKAVVAGATASGSAG